MSRARRSLVAGLGSLGVLTASLLTASPAEAFSTRVHIMVANEVREALVLGGGDSIALRMSPYSVHLSAADVKALTDQPLAFRAGAIGPDNMVFPGMTDPSHAVGSRPYEQCQRLYDAAVDDEERAYAMGCFLHGATDALAHHYVNYMSGETFTLTPITSGRQQSWTNVVRHILAEDMLQKKAAAQTPDVFSPGLLAHAIPKGFVLRTYLDYSSPVWELMASHSKARFDAAIAANPGASLPTVLAKSGMAPADHLAMAPVYVAQLQLVREQLRADVKAKIAQMQDWSTPEGQKLQLLAGPDGMLGTSDDDALCSAGCPKEYATYFTYVALLAPRYDAGGNELPSAFDKISDKLGDDLSGFLPAYVATVENLSAKLNAPIDPQKKGLGITKAEVAEAFSPMKDWADQITTIDFETLVHAVVPDWIIKLQDAMNAVGVNIQISGLVQAVFSPVIAPVKEAIKSYVIDAAEEYLGTLIDQLEASEGEIEAEYEGRLTAAAGPGLGGEPFDHLHDTGLFAHAFNIAAATLANHQVVLPDGDDPGATKGPASFDASHTPAWTQAALCPYLREAIFPLGHTVKGSLSVRLDQTFVASVDDDSPVECHDGSLFAFTSTPGPSSCGLVELEALIDDPSHRGTVSRAYPPSFGAQPVGCRNIVVPGLPDPPAGGGGAGGSSSSQGGSGGSSGGSSGGNAGKAGSGGKAGAPAAGAGGVGAAGGGAGGAGGVVPGGSSGASGKGAGGKAGAKSTSPQVSSAQPSTDSDGGCGCSIPGGSGGSGGAAAGLFALVAAASRRKRSARRAGRSALALGALWLLGCSSDPEEKIVYVPVPAEGGAAGQAGQGSGGSAGKGQGGAAGQGGAGATGGSSGNQGAGGSSGASGKGGSGGSGGSGGAAGGSAGSGGAGKAGAGGFDQSCCQAHPTSIGCVDMAVASCVCAKDSYCCEMGWDDQCLGEVTSFGCGACAGAGGSGGSGGSGGTAGSAGSGGTAGSGGGVSAKGKLLMSLGNSQWHGTQTRTDEKGVTRTRGYQIEFRAGSLQWAEIENPYGPSRQRQLRAFTVDDDGATLHTTVQSPAGWPISPDNGKKATWTVQVVDGSPRKLKVTGDGGVEVFDEGPWPAPTSGLTASVRVFPTGKVSDAFCTSGLNGFDYQTVFEFARGKSATEAIAEDVVAGAKLTTWHDGTGNNQFAITDVDGFDQLGGTDLSDQYNFFVTYTGWVKHPGGLLQMKEKNDSVEDGLWVFLDDKVGSANTNDLFLEVQGFAWPDKTPDVGKVSLPSGNIPVEIIVVRCAKQISDVDVMISLDSGSFTLVGDAPTVPAVDDALFPPALF